jgi:hypothetical protein
MDHGSRITDHACPTKRSDGGVHGSQITDHGSQITLARQSAATAGFTVHGSQITLARQSAVTAGFTDHRSQFTDHGSRLPDIAQRRRGSQEIQKSLVVFLMGE